MTPYSHHLPAHIKQSAKKPKAQDLLDTESWTSAFNDYLPGLDGSGVPSMARTGRASAMARAIGMEEPFSVKYPQTSQILTMLGTTALGATAGGLWADSANRGEGGIGLLLGGYAGLLGGALGNSYWRRDHLKNIAAEFEKAKTLKPTPPELFGELGRAFTPGSGIHNLADVRTYNYLKGKDPNNPARYSAEDLMGSSFPLIGGYSQNRDATDELAKPRKKTKK